MLKIIRIDKFAYIMSLVLLGGCVAEDADVTTISDGTVVATADLEHLGERLFNDTNLSSPIGQSCASCHNGTTGFDDPNNSQPTSLGADGSSVGTRNSPTASYAAHVPDPLIEIRPVHSNQSPQAMNSFQKHDLKISVFSYYVAPGY